MYGLPHPLQLLDSPPKKDCFKRLVKKTIVKYWHGILAREAQQLHSLYYFNPVVHSLTHPHPLWMAAGSSPYKVNKATILARMISGRYRTEKLCRFWSDNPGGYCLASTCNKVVGDLEHMLLYCPALSLARNNLHDMWLYRSAQYPGLLSLVSQVLHGPETLKMIFILDPTSIPAVDHLISKHGMQVLDLIFYMTMSLAYGLHRKKLILTGRWPYATKNENCKYYNSDMINCLTVAGTPDTDKEEPVTRTVAINREASLGDDTAMLGSYYREAPSLMGENASLGGSTFTPMYPSNKSMFQEPVRLATAGPEQGGQPGCGGHAATLDHLAGVVDISCVERPLLGYHGDPPTCVSIDSPLASEDVTDSVGAPWPSYCAAPAVSQQYWVSLT